MNNETAIAILCELKKCYFGGIVDALDFAIEAVKAQKPITGETSDGYHTFNELYHHRAVLFSVIVANYKDHAWKSMKHHDGTMYDGMFIVGIDTPDGQATYHYDIDPYWDMFDCEVREFAPKWDGHTPAQAIERISKLKAREFCEDAVSRKYLLDQSYSIKFQTIDESDKKAYREKVVCVEDIEDAPSVKLIPIARVMTLEEVKHLASGDDVWIEYHELTGWTISAVTVRENYGDGMLCRLQSLRFGFDSYDSYSGDWMAWRCWTSRPTDEQRKAVKWDG